MFQALFHQSDSAPHIFAPVGPAGSSGGSSGALDSIFRRPVRGLRGSLLNNLVSGLNQFLHLGESDHPEFFIVAQDNGGGFIGSVAETSGEAEAVEFG